MLMLLHKPNSVCHTVESGLVRMHVKLRLVPECRIRYVLWYFASFTELYDIVVSNMQDKGCVFRIRSISHILFYNSLFLLAGSSVFQ